ncbi:ribonuclease J [Mangrovibrevibacter kandeliae]|uniref:ribonuclease J n=1 Tax=Mangrovibrevibacter kandeliae TaxID=2968473 RepID=UPI002117B40F|nr:MULTISPECIES: ribonuclease J [unclassified Aurantimonas]MCQ8782659.1 ribonuclease J [Aurantimonas sp. CSK15Z-1]MCW4114532.1 ribonuclease J [Aurantimonas sp. MSK8Z-1]
MNLALYGYGPEDDREWIAVDCGVSFAGPEAPGVDLIMPDIRFLEAERHALKAIVITHAHEDHYGALLDLWPRLKVPVYATAFTAGLLEAKREGETGAPQIPVTVFKAGDRFQCGPFSIEAINVTHSIPEPVALAIRTPVGTVVHTGDWKIDPTPALGAPTDGERLRAIGDEGVLALVCDSTNALRDGVSPSETDVTRSLRDIISKAEGRVAVTTFSSNIGRIRAVAQAAEGAGRQVLLMGRSMRRMNDVASELGYMEGLPPFLSEQDFGYLPRDKAVIILTGSQGEPRAALAKLARDEHPEVALSKGDMVIFSSRAIPGNERGIIDIKNALIDRGVIVLEDGEQLVHVSGHPRRSELKQMYDWVRPKIAVPAHGEAAHLTAHAKFARGQGVPEVVSIRNGRMLRLYPGPAEVIDEVPVGRVYKDGRLIGTIEEMGIDERRRLSFAGHVCVLVQLNAQLELRGEPDVVALGLPEADFDGEEIEDLLIDAAAGAIESIPRNRRKDLAMLQEAVRRAVRAAANDAWGKKPIATVFVTQAGGKGQG